MKHNFHRTVLGVLASLLVGTACGSEPKPAPRAADAPIQAPPPPSATASPPVAAPVEKPQASSIIVSKDIRSSCGITEPKTYFGYNSAKVRKQDQSALKQLAHCVTGGPLSQRRLQLVGHADPRGSQDYNYQLGQSRANSVKTAMLGLGVAAAQLNTSSRGKLDAIGSTESGWALDRRVEVSLAD